MPASVCRVTRVSVKWSIYVRREPGGTAGGSQMLRKPMAPGAARKAHIKKEWSARGGGVGAGGEG